MSEEPTRQTDGLPVPPLARVRSENHVCEFDVCGKRAPFGFAKPTTITLDCFEHREHGDSYLAGVR